MYRICLYKDPLQETVSVRLVRNQGRYEYLGNRRFFIGLRPDTNVGGTEEVQSWKGVGGYEKELLTSMPEALAKIDKSELAGKSVLPDLRSLAHQAAKVRPWKSLWESVALCGYLLWGSIAEPGATVGQQGHLLSRRAGHRAEESKDKLGPTRLLCISLLTCLTVTTSQE